MKFFNKDAKETIEGLEKMCAEAENESLKLSAELEQIKESLSSKDQTIAELTKASADLEDQLNAEKETNQTLKAELDQAKADIEFAENSAVAKAKEIAASAGHSGKLVPESDDTQTAAKIKFLQEKIQTSQGTDAYKAVKELNQLKDK